MRYVVAFLVVIASFGATAASDDEISLFDGRGKAAAYVAVDDELTIYLWSGKPVAYLYKDGGKVHVYGFNGKHLGWFGDGVMWDSEGKVVCATKERLRSTEFEPFKSFKEFKPFKSFREFAPFQPFLTKEWSKLPCKVWLALGEES